MSELAAYVNDQHRLRGATPKSASSSSGFSLFGGSNSSDGSRRSSRGGGGGGGDLDFFGGSSSSNNGGEPSGGGGFFGGAGALSSMFGFLKTVEPTASSSSSSSSSASAGSSSGSSSSFFGGSLFGGGDSSQPKSSASSFVDLESGAAGSAHASPSPSPSSLAWGHGSERVAAGVKAGGHDSSQNASGTANGTGGDEDGLFGGALGWFQHQANALATTSNSAFDSVRHRLLGTEAPEQEAPPPPPTGIVGRTILRMGDWMPTLNKRQRLAGFVVLLLGCVACFGSAIFMLPVMFMQPRRFLLLLMAGNVFAMAAFAFLRGPQAHLAHMFSPDRSTVTLLYFGSTLGTLYCMLWLQSGLLTTLFALTQLAAVGVYFWSYLPGGTHSLRFLGSMFAKTATTVGSAMV